MNSSNDLLTFQERKEDYHVFWTKSIDATYATANAADATTYATFPIPNGSGSLSVYATTE
ncbi:hypothetical protein LG307_15345 [Sutcliffiella horikoshii]|uniref:hypothetical protein n=1 Tax=Sutcliffiella horikoshii TaxID=79883 RepID=UPI00384D198B